MKYLSKLRHIYRAVAAISADGACEITWKSVANWLRYQRKRGKNNDKNAQRSVKTHCRQWVCGYCYCLGISFFFRLTTSDVRFRRQKPPNSEKKCSVTHVQRGSLTKCCFNDGPHFQRSGDVETVLFQCITLITFGILYQTSPNVQGSRRNGCERWMQKYMWSGWELTEISTKNAPPALVQCWLSALH